MLYFALLYALRAQFLGDGFMASVPGAHRFLAVCVGAHVYRDGMLDGDFGYSRVALFDIDTKRLIDRINGPAYTYAALSPDGKLIALEHLGTIKLYRAN
jgi:hypothetical protein